MVEIPLVSIRDGVARHPALYSMALLHVERLSAMLSTKMGDSGNLTPIETGDF